MVTLEEYKKNFSILVVDDNEDNCFVLMQRLKREGFEKTKAVHDGFQVLEVLKKEKFDLILLDIMMPGMDGYEVLERLRDEIIARRIMVLMISAHDKLESVLRCIKLGAEDFLPKPFNLELLRARIGSCIERKWFIDQEAERKNELTKEKQRYQNLLYSIFPPAVVDELTRTNQVKPRSHENVAVLFSDIVKFTTYCNIHTPEEVLGNLQEFVQMAETVALRYGVEKIKTIGDALLATSGMLQRTNNSVLDCVKCALAMIDESHNLPAQWSLRVGISYGTVVSGIVGHRQYLFDVWGDTVNTASRVQNQAQPNTVYVTKAAWECIKNEVEGESVGDFEMKGKETLTLYKVTSVK